MKQNNILINDLDLFDEGFMEACELIATTLGANGKLSLLDNEHQGQPPRISKDGISVIKNTRFPNKTKNFGCLKAIEGCGLTLSRSGDSTTSTGVLMGAYLKSFKRKDFNKAVERGMYKAVSEVYEHLENLAKRPTKKQLKEVVTVACNGDKELASIISEAYEYSGKDGVLEPVLKPEKREVEFIKQDGMVIKGHGYASEYFVNKENKNFCFEGQDVAVICSSTWDYNQNILSSIQSFYSSNPKTSPLVLFLERPNSSMLEKMISIRQSNYNVNLVYTNENTEYDSETLLNDIANLTGASVYNPRNADSEIVFGLADKVISNLDSTTVLVEDVPQIFKDTLELLKSAEKKDEKRIKRLTTKSSVVSVGGVSPSIASETFDRVEDAIFSLKTSLKEGIIPGGGTTLVFISGLMKTKLKNKEEQQGYDLVKKVIKAPFLQLLKNNNRKTAKKYEFWKKDYLSPALNNFGVGYNSVKDEISNLYEDGVIDSKLSIRVSIESSLEIAVQMFNIGSIVHFPESQSL